MRAFEVAGIIAVGIRVRSPHRLVAMQDVAKTAAQWATTSPESA